MPPPNAARESKNGGGADYYRRFQILHELKIKVQSSELSTRKFGIHVGGLQEWNAATSGPFRFRLLATLFDSFRISGQLLCVAVNWFEFVTMRNTLFTYESGRAQKVNRIDE